ncbi:MAG: hypothetical protein QNL11_01055, partial [Desulfobacterales bacterium]|nr:hypothetical protein [Desulfobacterales bacterium]
TGLILQLSLNRGQALFKICLFQKYRCQKFTVTSDMQPSIFGKELKSPPDGFPKGYPCYIVITKDDITDIIELRKMAPFFI